MNQQCYDNLVKSAGSERSKVEQNIGLRTHRFSGINQLVRIRRHLLHFLEILETICSISVAVHHENFKSYP